MNISPKLPLKSIPERPGTNFDLQLLIDERWLKYSNATYVINREESKWLLTMIFVDKNDPLRLVCKEINRYPSYKEAQNDARILQKKTQSESKKSLIRGKGLTFCHN